MKFELFGRLKGKPKVQKSMETPATALGGLNQDIPVSVINQMSSSGLSQNEIINELRNQGFSYSQINKALNDIVKNEAVREINVQPRENSQEAFPPRNQGMDMSESNYQEDFHEEFNPLDQKAQKETHEELEQGPTEPLVPESTEELIEVMIAEKLIDVEDHFEKIGRRLDSIQKDLEKIREDVKELQIRKDEDEKRFLGKVDELEQYMEASHGKIGGLEKALQQVLPTLVENVRDLTSMMREVKSEK